MDNKMQKKKYANNKKLRHKNEKSEQRLDHETAINDGLLKMAPYCLQVNLTFSHTKSVFLIQLHWMTFFSRCSAELMGYDYSIK